MRASSAFLQGMQRRQLFITYSDVDFDQEGFWLPQQRTTLIKWADVVRVAACYEIHPIAVADWDYWAFQTSDPDFYPWVEINKRTEAKGFSREIYQRYGEPDIPAMKHWANAEYCILTYVIYPKSGIGKPLYVMKKKHWWAWSSHIYHAQV
jgi:hypothetical protein